MSDTTQKEPEPFDFKFGTFTGVFVPNVTMMFGVILFLRLSLVLGYLGIWEFLGVVLISLAIMLITSLSTASVVTNMKVGGGGAYFLISRSLGIEIGGAIGITLVLARMISLALVVTGFAYSITSLYPKVNVYLVELITMVCLLIVTLVSTNLALKTQQLIFWTLCGAIVSVFFFAIPTDNPIDLRFFKEGLTFWQGFAIFFPAVTGIEAGMALSGSLRNPSRSLAFGNIWSLLFVTTVYTALALFLWYIFPPVVLQSSAFLLIVQSKMPFLVYLGIWLATLSTALGNLLGAPRMLQMISEDGIIPEFLSRTYGKYQEPHYSTAVVFLVSLVLLLTTTIDQIIPILTMMGLLTYGSLNLVAGFEELIHSPTWRPTFKTPWQLSFLGAIGCYTLMFIINPVWAAAAIVIVFTIYIVLRSRGFEVTYQDLINNITFFFSRTILYRLSKVEKQPTTWHPQILFVTRLPIQNEMMVRIANDMAIRNGILTVASIVPEFWAHAEKLEQLEGRIKEWLDENDVQALTEINAYKNYYEGMENLVKSYGLGPLQPNTLWVPISDNFEEEVSDMISVVKTAQQNGKNLILSLYKEEKERIPFSFGPKRIDLWWDPDHRESFELMMSYLLSLRTGAIWAKRVVKLKATVTDETAKHYLEDHFRQLFTHLRLKFKPKIEIEPTGESYEHLKKYSQKADMIIAPLKPITDFEDDDSYQAYLLHLWSSIPADTPLLAVTSYDSLNHREIYSD